MTIFPAASDKGTPAPAPDIIVLRGLNLFYGDFQALKGIDVTFPRQAITALIGPSGCGKSTLLRTLNRMNDLIEGCASQARFSSTGWTSSAPRWSSPSCGKRWAWSSSAPTPFPCPSTTTWSTARASMGSLGKPNWKRFGALPHRGGNVGRSQGSPQDLGPVAHRRAAAAPVHRPGSGGGTGNPAYGRTLLGPRPHSHP